MPTERITLDLDATALYAARFVADAHGVSLDDWISTVVRERGIAAAMAAYVPHDAPPGWDDEGLDRIFGGEGGGRGEGGEGSAGR